jgi:hypothetical protein
MTGTCHGYETGRLTHRLPQPHKHTNTHTALYYPYIIAYEPSLIEIWNCETAELEQIIPTNNLRNLNTDKEILHFTMDTGDWENQYLFRLQILDAVEVDE